jgi:hypothetical protein
MRTLTLFLLQTERLGCALMGSCEALHDETNNFAWSGTRGKLARCDIVSLQFTDGQF